MTHTHLERMAKSRSWQIHRRNRLGDCFGSQYEWEERPHYSALAMTFVR